LRLGSQATVFDDNSIDLLLGQSGMDLFFSDLGDIDDQGLNEISGSDLGELLA
jgi:hypothetical protein